VLAGGPDPGPTLEELRRLEQAGGVRLLTFLDRATLESLYAACEVFALPSIHEGTGLVALEAAACGAKVVITKNGGPPDYFQTYAEYVDPRKETDIARALRAAWEKPRTDELRRHVLENLSWKKSAEQLVAAYTAR
jgi:glycosyltransferase involved in cell wall biosynthesis